MAKEDTNKDLEEIREGIINEPTLHYRIGDEIIYGGFKAATITGIYDDGKIYKLCCTTTHTNYGNPYDEENIIRLTAWTEIRSLIPGNTSFTTDWNIRIDAYQSNISSLLFHYYRGIDMDPEYQRGYVWDIEDKVSLIDSIFNKINIGQFTLVYLSFKEYKEKGSKNGYEILDGKQRLNAIIEFYEGRFTYKGKLFSELSSKDYHTFTGHTISFGEIKDVTMKQRIECFLRLNTQGKGQDLDHLNKVQKLLTKQP